MDAKTGDAPIDDTGPHHNFFARLRYIVSRLGFPQTLVYAGVKILYKRLPEHRILTLFSRRAAHPLLLRPQTSDLSVFWQVFVVQQYAHVPPLKKGLIIDCGANVGYTSSFFLSLEPETSVVAVEPDPDNYALLEKNLARFGSRVRTVRAGIWPRACPLKVMPESGAWGRKVQECSDAEVPDTTGIDIPTLIRGSGFDSVQLLKIDIEGAEFHVFSSPELEWLSKVETIAIELHGDDCRRVFFDAIREQNFEVFERGELTICHRTSTLNHETITVHEDKAALVDAK